MALLLHIETSASCCSVCLSDNDTLLSLKEEKGISSHAGKTTLFIEEVLLSSGKSIDDVDAVSVSIGPGSYTGLRIGLSTAKGICYAKNIPLIGVSSLQAIAWSMFDQVANPDALYIPILDARRMEVYMAAYNGSLHSVQSPSAVVFDRNVFEGYPNSELYIGGTGVDKISAYTNDEKIHIVKKINFSAQNLIFLAFQSYKNKSYIDLAYSVPHYLKSFFGSKQ